MIQWFVMRIHCPGEHFVSSLGGVVVFIFSALGNCVRRRASKSSQRSYSFPRWMNILFCRIIMMTADMHIQAGANLRTLRGNKVHCSCYMIRAVLKVWFQRSFHKLHWWKGLWVVKSMWPRTVNTQVNIHYNNPHINFLEMKVRESWHWFILRGEDRCLWHHLASFSWQKLWMSITTLPWGNFTAIYMKLHLHILLILIQHMLNGSSFLLLSFPLRQEIHSLLFAQRGHPQLQSHDLGRTA